MEFITIYGGLAVCQWSKADKTMASIHFDSSIRTALHSMRSMSDHLRVMNDQASTGLSVPSARASSVLWGVSQLIELDYRTAAAEIQNLTLQRTRSTSQLATIEAVLDLTTTQRDILIKAQQAGVDLGKLQAEYDALSAQKAILQESQTFQDALSPREAALNYNLITELPTETLAASFNPQNDVTFEGTADWNYAAGPVSGLPSVELEGNDGDAVTLPDVYVHDMVTMGAWARFDDTSGRWQRIMELGSGAGTNNILIAQSARTDDIAFVHCYGRRSSAVLIVANAIVEGEWAHWLATIDGAGNAAIYKNGVLIGSAVLAPLAAGARSVNLSGDSNWSSDSSLDGGLASPVLLIDQAVDAAGAMEIYLNSQSPGNVTSDNELTGYTESYSEQIISDISAGTLEFDDPVTQAFLEQVDVIATDIDAFKSVQALSNEVNSFSLTSGAFTEQLTLLDQKLRIVTDLASSVGIEQKTNVFEADYMSQRASILETARYSLVAADIEALPGTIDRTLNHIALVQYAMGVAMTRWQNVLQLFRV